MAIYSGFSHWRWWFSIVMWQFTRGYSRIFQDPEQIGQSWWFQVSPLHHAPQLVHRGDTREVSLARSSGNEGDDAGPMGQWWMDLGLGKWVEVNYGFAQTWLGNPKVWMWKKKSGNLSSTPCLMTAKGFGIVSTIGDTPSHDQVDKCSGWTWWPSYKPWERMGFQILR